MVSNAITKKLQIHACYHKTYLRMYRCQLKTFFIKTIKIWEDIFSSLYIVITKWSYSKSRSRIFWPWKYCHKKATVYMALGHKCKKSYIELVLKRQSVKMQVYGKSQSQMGPTWIFFTDSQFLPIPRELVFIFDKTTYYLCLICNGRDR